MSFISFLKESQGHGESISDNTYEMRLTEAEKHKPKNARELKTIANDLGVHLGDIDTSSVNDMSLIFEDSKRTDFSGIETWDVSKVTSFGGMFKGCKDFDADLSKWDVSHAKDFSSMFAFCAKFKGKGLEKWRVKGVKECAYMFIGCKEFDADLKNWQLDDDADIFGMFGGCVNFKGEGLETGFRVLTRYKVSTLNNDIFGGATKAKWGSALDAYRSDRVDWNDLYKDIEDAVKKIPDNDNKKAVYWAKRIWGTAKANLEFQFVTKKAEAKFRRNGKKITVDFVDALEDSDDIKGLKNQYLKDIKGVMN